MGKNREKSSLASLCAAGSSRAQRFGECVSQQYPEHRLPNVKSDSQRDAGFRSTLTIHTDETKKSHSETVYTSVCENVPVCVRVHVCCDVCLCEEPSVLSSVRESEMGWSDGICALTPPPLHLSSLPILTPFPHFQLFSVLPCIFLSDYTV